MMESVFTSVEAELEDLKGYIASCIAMLEGEGKGLLAVQIGRIKEENDRLKGKCRNLEAAIRKHRDERGDDRCWKDDEELYQVLSEGYTPPERDTAVELHNCEKFIACRQNPATVYVSPQRRIEELLQENERLRRRTEGFDPA
jgi:hypothetical protein